MRNLIWTGTALALVIGAGFFVLARHAARHPTSLVARCSVAIYRMCDALLAPRGEAKPAAEIAEAPPAPPPATPAPALDVVEPIVVEPTDEEPPLAIPRLSPDIAAAIERLRGEEDSEAPPQAFDNPSAVPRMPYADEDEDVEMLPLPALDDMTGQVEVDVEAPVSGLFLFLPRAWWQAAFDQFMETLRHHGQQGSEESVIDDMPENEP